MKLSQEKRDERYQLFIGVDEMLDRQIAELMETANKIEDAHVQSYATQLRGIANRLGEFQSKIKTFAH